MSDFATLADVLTLTGKVYTSEEQERILNLLPLVSDALRYEAEKVGKDYVLLAIMTFTIMVMIFGWGNFDNYNRALYVLLSASLAITYAKRHAKLNEVQEMWLDRVGYVTMGVAIILFAAVVYMQYIA